MGVTKQFMVDDFNDDMSPGKVGQFDHRVPQRRDLHPVSPALNGERLP